MGYRSDVAYTIRFKRHDDMVLFITEAKSKDYGTPALNECDVDMDKLHINFFAESVKWYESYADVQVHEELVQQARDWIEEDNHRLAKEGEPPYMNPQDEYKLGFIFTRVGEDTDDNTEDCGGDADWDWVRISRQIVRDWD